MALVLFREENISQHLTTAPFQVSDSRSLSAEELANLVNISVLLAKERMLLAEKAGKLCRDDSDEGLRFFPNLFLLKSS